MTKSLPKTNLKILILIIFSVFLMSCLSSLRLNTAVKNGNLSQVKELVEKGANLEIGEGYATTPLNWAAYKGHIEIVQYLIEKGANVNVIGYRSNSSLHLAVEQGYIEIVKYLIEKGANLEIKNDEKKTALHLAAEKGYIEIVKYLIERGAKINERDYRSNTSLHLAAEKGYIETVKYLVEKGANLEIKNDEEETALHFAVAGGYIEIVKYLVKKGANYKSNMFHTALHFAAAGGHIEVVKYLVGKGANINVRGHRHNTALHFAAAEGHIEVVKYLIKKGANINIRGYRSNTALHFAAAGGHIEVVKYLVGKGANINVRGYRSNTALHFAAAEGHIEVVKYLVKKRANIEVKDINNWTPLDHAIIESHTNIVKYLVERGAKIKYAIRYEAERQIKIAKKKEQERKKIIKKIEQTKKEKIQFTKNDKLDFSKYKKIFAYKIKQYETKPFNAISKYSNINIKKHLLLKDLKFPKKISIPKLPLALNLIQEDWELDGEFEARVNVAKEKRKKEIEKLQAEYRKEVEARNKKIDNLNNIQKKRKDEIETTKNYFIHDAFKEVMKGFTLSNPALDKKTGDIFLDLKAKNANYTKRIAVSTKNSKSLRKVLYKNPEKVDFTLEFKISEKGEISFSKLVVKASGEEEFAKLVSPNKKASQTSALVATIDMQDNALKTIQKLQKQNPNLQDNYEIGTIIYKDGREVKLAFNDDIPSLIKNSKSSNIDKTKWLFVIGAEKYQNTDNINFAKRSAKLFTEAMQKKFGIRKSNTIALYDEKATAGAIKDNTKLLLKNVQESDTIYFYYNGHGIPVKEEDNEAYLLPTDKIPDFIADDSWFKLKNFYKLLSDSKAKKVFAFVDSCFTGITDGKSVYKGDKAATRLVPKKVLFDETKMVLITAGNENQFSSSYKRRGHRLFSYFLIKSILNDRKDIKNIYQEVSLNVSDVSKGESLKSRQDPTISGNKDLKL